MREEEDEECERGPKPADLDEEDVEEVAFLREIRGGQGGRMGLRRGVVRRRPCGGVEEGEERADDEGCGVD